MELKVVKAGRRAFVTISGLETGQILGTFRANKKGKLEKKIYLSQGQVVPCNIQVETPGGSAIRAVEEAPADCGGKGNNGGGDGGEVTPGHEDLDLQRRRHLPGMSR